MLSGYKGISNTVSFYLFLLVAYPKVSTDTKLPGDQLPPLYKITDQATLNKVTAVLGANGENRNFWIDGTISGNQITFGDGTSMAVDSALFQPNEPNGSGACLHLW